MGIPLHSFLNLIFDLCDQYIDYNFYKQMKKKRTICFRFYVVYIPNKYMLNSCLVDIYSPFIEWNDITFARYSAILPRSLPNETKTLIHFGVLSERKNNVINFRAAQPSIRSTFPFVIYYLVRFYFLGVFLLMVYNMR